MLLASLSLSVSFEVSHHVEKKVAILPSSRIEYLHSLNRVIVVSIIAILGWSADNYNRINMNPPPAYALQERNEVLCGTGFFTNVGAWYCTDIGNIGDEGVSKPLSKKDEASVDSLMSKFNFEDSSTADEGESSSSNQGKRKESGKANTP